MSEKEKTVKMLISVDINTTKPNNEIRKALERGIYRGLDSAPNYIAPPTDVKINYIHEH